jgi:hypothetical protein
VRAVLVACCIGVVLAAGSLRAETPEAKPCKPRAGEKNGVRFVEVCGAGVFISAAPLVCTPAETESAACDPMTALESSLLPGPGKNRHADVLMAEAERAERLCQERLGGRLPTPRERELARSSLGLVSLQVREEPGDYARLRLDELPEWVAEDGRVTRSLAVAARPRVTGEVLLGCVAEPALAHATAVSIGEVCDERPLEADVRSPNCALALPGAAARFELGCDPAHPVPSRALPDHAALRCVLPESELRFPQAVGGSPPAP